MSRKIIDVSHHQGKIDWDKVKADGVQGAIIRVSDSTGTMDRECDRNIRECERLGIPFGLYIYSRATNEKKIRQEADIILNKAHGHKLEFPIYLDLEQAGCENYAVQAGKIFGDIIESRGYWCGIYANEYWFKSFIKNGLDKYTKWVAKYSKTAPSVPNVDMWQYSSSGKVEGIIGNVDMNECYRDFPTEISGNESEQPKKPNEPVTPEGTVMQLATECLMGNHGTGEARKHALGTKYDDVQAEINHRLYSSISILVKETIDGRYGNGKERVNALGSRYDAVQDAINKKNQTVAPKPQPVYHVIKSGEALSGIANKFGTPMATLQKWNGISNPNKIYAGKKIRVK